MSGRRPQRSPRPPTHGRRKNADRLKAPTTRPTATSPAASGPCTYLGTAGTRTPSPVKYASEASVTATNAGVSRAGRVGADRRATVRIIAASFVADRRQRGRPRLAGASVGLPIPPAAGGAAGGDDGHREGVECATTT